MIKLLIEECCYDCPNFEVMQEISHTFIWGEDGIKTNHNLKCRNVSVCKSIREHLLGVNKYDR